MFSGFLGERILGGEAGKPVEEVEREIQKLVLST
jgi:hypothetical protein